VIADFPQIIAQSFIFSFKNLSVFYIQTKSKLSAEIRRGGSSPWQKTDLEEWLQAHC
jgi:hypothetical protein